MKCKNCNKSIGSNVKFCWNCGAEQEVKKKGLSAGAIVGIVFLSIFIFFVCLGRHRVWEHKREIGIF